MSLQSFYQALISLMLCFYCMLEPEIVHFKTIFHFNQRVSLYVFCQCTDSLTHQKVNSRKRISRMLLTWKHISHPKSNIFFSLQKQDQQSSDCFEFSWKCGCVLELRVRNDTRRRVTHQLKPTMKPRPHRVWVCACVCVLRSGVTEGFIHTHLRYTTTPSGAVGRFFQT